MRNKTQINDHIFIDQGQLLGKGSTGNVYLGFSSKFLGKRYAVKAIDLSEVNNQVTQYLLSCQIAALSQLAKLNIRSIVKLQDIGFNQKFCFLVMELLEGGPLSQYIKQNLQGLRQNQYMHLFRQMFEGYKAIKHLSIVHRDIKPDNLIFRQKYENDFQENQVKKNVCFIDFGYCTMQKVPNRPKAYYNVGSPKYMSPQAFRQNIYSEKSDIWALGIILYEMIHGKTIDSGMEMDQYIDFMRNNPIPVTRNINSLVKKLLQGMLTFDYRKRISCEGIQQLLNFEQKIQPINLNNNDESIPSLNLNRQQNKRNSQFFRSQVIPSDRSHPQFRQFTEQQTQIIDPRRQFRNFSNEKRLKQYSNSPKKIFHTDHYVQRIPITSSNRLNNNLQITNSQYFHLNNGSNLIQKFRNQRLQRIIQDQNQNQASKNQNSNIKVIFNPNSQNFEAKRNFLRTTFYNQNPQQPVNPNIRLLNEQRFSIQNPEPVKNHVRQNQVFRSEMFPSNNNTTNDFNINRRNNIFFASQIISNNPQDNIKVITSDKLITSNQLNPNAQYNFSKQLNKSYSTNNVQLIPEKKENLYQEAKSIPQVFHRQPLMNAYVNEMKPIDRLVNNKQIPNVRGFLRNTMPAFKSTIIQSPQTQNIINTKQEVENLNSSRTLDKNFIQNSQQTVYRNHAPYFNEVQNRNLNSDVKIHQNITPFNTNPLDKQQNREVKSNSFKIIPQSPQFISGFFRPSHDQNQPVNNQKSPQSQIPIGHHFNQHVHDRFQQVHNKFIQFTHQKNHFHHNFQSNVQYHSQNSNVNSNHQNTHQNPHQNPSFVHNAPQIHSNQNKISDQAIRRSYMINQQPPKQKRIPNFILNNKQNNPPINSPQFPQPSQIPNQISNQGPLMPQQQNQNQNFIKNSFQRPKFINNMIAESPLNVRNVFTNMNQNTINQNTINQNGMNQNPINQNGRNISNINMMNINMNRQIRPTYPQYNHHNQQQAIKIVHY